MGTLALYPMQLSPGAVGQRYVMVDQPLTPVGGVGPFTWALTGNLPPGLSLNTNSAGSDASSAVIEGTPRVADQYNYAPVTVMPEIVNPSTFTIAVTDSSTPPLVASRQYTIPVGVFSERQAISIYEMLCACYSQDYYVVMNDMGSREIRIGDLGSPAFGGLRMITNALLSAFTQGMIEVMLEHIREWNQVKRIFMDQAGGSVSDITGLNNKIGDRKAGLFMRLKTILPAYTMAEVRARQNKGGGNDFTGSVAGSGGARDVEFVR